jgi:hypothetical protein
MSPSLARAVIGTTRTWATSKVGLGSGLGDGLDEGAPNAVVGDGIGVADWRSRFGDPEFPLGDGIVPDVQAAVASKTTANRLGKR